MQAIVQVIRQRLQAIFILAFLFLVIFIPPALALSFTGGSSLSGLVELKQMAKQSIPYETALQNPQPTLIEFYADWCNTCQSMASTIHQLSEIETNQVNLVMLNIDDPQWMPLVEDYQVNGIPKFVVLNADNAVQDTLVGRVPKVIFQDIFWKLTP
jgi:thiol:disulfide interchange protein